MPRSFANRRVRSLSLAIARALSGAIARTAPSALKSSRRALSALMLPSPVGRTTRVGFSRMNLRIASAYAAASKS